MAKKQPQGPSGLMVIDKPAGMSSHDAVSQMRRIAGTRRVGHAGTLDPAATGVLILGINKATKLLTYLVGQDKTYDATIRLGLETLTEDAEGEHTAAHPDAVEALTGLDAEQMHSRILEAVAQLSGDILQVPSAVSAIKINGVRSYARVRSGEQVELAARPVTISEFTVHSINPGFAEYVIEDPENEGEHAATSVPVIDCKVTVSCSSGTYIRAHSRILEAVAQLSGDILQVPSAVSAIKINGVRSYARVRSGEQVELAARPVTISEFTVHSINPGFAEYVIEDPENEGEHAATSVPVIDCKVTVSCSSGTYIRALARDLGKILGTGGHLTALRRTRVGAVVLEDAADLAQLKQRREESEAPLEDLPLLPLEEAARRIFGARELSAAEASDISYGRRISPSGDGSVVKRSVHASADESGAVQHASVEGIVAGFAPDGTLVALLENKKQRGKVLAAPVLVFEANRSFN